MVLFRDRQDAGRKLAAKLEPLRREQPVVLGLPRGGVVVAAEIAAALDAPLDVLVVRKLPAPHQPELALGAVTDGARPRSVLNDEIVQALEIPREYLDAVIERQLDEVRRRQQRYRAGRPPVPLEGRCVIVVDDGVATGATVEAALRAVRTDSPRRLVLAVPVAPPETLARLARLADEVSCLSSPVLFTAVGAFYGQFGQTSDEEVERLLADESRESRVESRKSAE